MGGWEGGREGGFGWVSGKVGKRRGEEGRREG